MKQKRLVASIVICAFASPVIGCATTNRTRTLLLMGGVGATSATVGGILAPRGERPEMHAAFWGAAGAAIAGIVGLFVFDEQKRSQELERKAAVMRSELDALRDEGGGKEPKLLYETTAPFGKDIPTEYQSLVKPGHWSVYKLNQWVSHGESTVIHQDRMVKLIPPQLTPKSQVDSGESVGVSPSEVKADETKKTGGNKK